MTDNEFMAAYRIVSIRGRLYSRDSPLAGMVPARVVEEAVMEAIGRTAVKP